MLRKICNSAVLAAMLLAASPSGAAALDAPTGMDKALTQAVNRVLADSAYDTHVMAESRDGTVHLHGFVYTREQLEDVMRRASEVTGVNAVDAGQLVLLPGT